MVGEKILKKKNNGRPKNIKNKNNGRPKNI